MSWHSPCWAQCCELPRSRRSEAGGFQASRACRARDASPDVASTRSSTTPPRRSQAARAAHPAMFRPVLALCSGSLATPAPGPPVCRSRHSPARHGTDRGYLLSLSWAPARQYQYSQCELCPMSADPERSTDGQHRHHGKPQPLWRSTWSFLRFQHVCAQSIFKKFHPLNTLLIFQEKTRIMSSKTSSWGCCKQWENAFPTFIYSYST